MKWIQFAYQIYENELINDWILTGDLGSLDAVTCLGMITSWLWRFSVHKEAKIQINKLVPVL